MISLNNARAGRRQDAEPKVSQVEQHTNPTVNNDCYTSGSSTSCQDFYTAKWCTTGGYAYGYDYTGCKWSGWNTDNVYCSGGWQWDANQTHRHCS